MQGTSQDVTPPSLSPLLPTAQSCKLRDGDEIIPSNRSKHQQADYYSAIRTHDALDTSQDSGMLALMMAVSFDPALSSSISLLIYPPLRIAAEVPPSAELPAIWFCWSAQEQTTLSSITNTVAPARTAIRGKRPTPHSPRPLSFNKMDSPDLTSHLPSTEQIDVAAALPAIALKCSLGPS